MRAAPPREWQPLEEAVPRDVFQAEVEAWAKRIGVHPKVVSERLGHANIAITDERYVHLEETERGKLLCQVSNNQIRQPDDELHTLLAKLDKQDLHRAITIAAGLLVER